MTEYDMLMANGEPHPLAGIPQAALDASRHALRVANRDAVAGFAQEDVEPVADAVLMEGLKQLGYRPTVRS